MPVYKISSLNKGYTLGIWHIKETPEELLPWAYLSKHETIYYQQLNNTRRKLHWLAWRALVKRMTENPLLEISYDPNGRPTLCKHSLQISVSHAGPWVACLVHPKKPTGVDVESVSPRIQKVKERFLSPQELEWHAAATNHLRHLTILWCIKESVYKYASISGLDFRNQIVVLPFNSGNDGEAFCQLIQNNGEFTLISLNYEDIDSEHVIARIAD